MIHGGIGREERLAVQEAFRHDPDVQVLLATDAAGEGIHLQRAHLMVNYDLPWNPNRLEQRFGRIHWIGQTEVCQLWNLVADDTREGDVYRRLLEKLERARQSLGGQVFDSLGKLEFEGATTLPKMLQHHRIEPWRTASARHSRHWAAEETHHPREVIEPALVHMVQTRSRRPTGFASRRTDPPWPILPADEDIFPAASRFRRMLVAGVQRIAPPGRRHAPAQRSGLRPTPTAPTPGICRTSSTRWPSGPRALPGLAVARPRGAARCRQRHDHQASGRWASLSGGPLSQRTRSSVLARFRGRVAASRAHAQYHRIAAVVHGFRS